MAALRGIEHLRTRLTEKRTRVLMRYRFYDMKHDTYDPGPVIPVQLKLAYKSVIGWTAKAVDSLADRLVFRGFDNDNFNIKEIYDLNNPDVLFDSAILGALISSCDFIYVSTDGSDVRLQVIDGGNATGEIDPITGLLTEGYAVLERDDSLEPVTEAYFTPEATFIYDSIDNAVQKIPNPTNHPLLVPIIYRPDASRPFGRSRISRAGMSLQDKAAQTLTRADVTAEFYSFPQKYILGVAQDLEPLDSWKATISAMLQFTKDDDGDHPVVGQFTQQSMEPHLSQFKLYASAFAGETGLTLDDLGFASDNPSSEEAIKASHESLRLMARKAQRTLGSGFLNVGYLAACLRDKKEYKRNQFYLTKPTWEPIFEPDAAALSSIGDGAIKINQAVEGYFDKDNLERLTGIKASI